MLGALTVLPGWGVEEGTNRERLDELGSRIQAERKAIVFFEHRESYLLDQLDSLEKDLVDHRVNVERYQQASVENEKRSAELHAAVASIRNEIAEYFTHLRGKLVQLYKLQRANPFTVVFAFRSFNDFVRNNKVIERILNEDLEYIEFFGEKVNGYQGTILDLRRQEQELQRQSQEEQRKETQLERRKKEKVRSLEQLRSEKAVHLGTLRELEEAAARLSKMVDGLQHTATITSKQESDFASRKGSLPVPVSSHRITATFGGKVDRVDGTKLFHKGLDFTAAPRSKVLAVFEGRVLFARPFQGYGNLVILDHGRGFYTLYAHLKTVVLKEGAWVVGGEPLGSLGEVGSGRGPVLYFELRRYGKNLDPTEWFDQRSLQY